MGGVWWEMAYGGKKQALLAMLGRDIGPLGIHGWDPDGGLQPPCVWQAQIWAQPYMEGTLCQVWASPSVSSAHVWWVRRTSQ